MNKLLFLAVLSFCLSCNGKKETSLLYTQLGEYLQSIGKDFRQTKVIYMIPKEACHSCLEKTVSFSKNYDKMKSILFIGMNFANKKEIRLGYGANFVQMSNVYFDFKKQVLQYKEIDARNLHAYLINHEEKQITKLLVLPSTQTDIHYKIRKRVFEE